MACRAVSGGALPDVAVAGRALSWPAAVPLTLLALALSSLARLSRRARTRPPAVRSRGGGDRCRGKLRRRAAQRQLVRRATGPRPLDRLAPRSRRGSSASRSIGRACILPCARYGPGLPPRSSSRPRWSPRSCFQIATRRARARPPHPTRANHPANMDALPPELLKQLAELLDAAENGTLRRLKRPRSARPRCVT